MAYKNFTLEKLRDEFGIQTRRQALSEFNGISEIQPSDWLLETLKNYQLLPNRSEKAKSEAIVSPILLEIKRRNIDFITIYSGEILTADSSKGLNGECDFIIARETHSLTIDAPLFCVVEAKKGDLDLGKAQCAAQMLGAKLFNQNHDAENSIVYGVVTTAKEWLFMKIENNLLISDDDNTISLVELPKLLGNFQFIVDFYRNKEND